MPAKGDSIEHDGWQFIAEEVEGRRIRRLKVVLTAYDTDERRTVGQRPRRVNQVTFAPMQVTLEGKVALVTGASKGIGRAIAAGMAEAGA